MSRQPVQWSIQKGQKTWTDDNPVCQRQKSDAQNRRDCRDGPLRKKHPGRESKHRIGVAAIAWRGRRGAQRKLEIRGEAGPHESICGRQLKNERIANTPPETQRTPKRAFFMCTSFAPLQLLLLVSFSFRTGHNQIYD
jgi:hypothetical protein